MASQLPGEIVVLSSAARSTRRLVESRFVWDAPDRYKALTPTLKASTHRDTEFE